jgi:small subunit ribosomal protein S4
MFNTTEKRERALGVKLFLKGSRCVGPKCALVRKPNRPGPHTKMRRNISEFSEQLQAKQRFQASYGIREAQMGRLFREALKNPAAITGEEILSLLERRLDNVVFRLGFAVSRSVARQLVGHGHITVNGRRVTVPSYRVRPKDVIAVRTESKEHPLFKGITEALKRATPPVWLMVDSEKVEGTVLTNPKDVETEFDTARVVDYYSK